MANPVLTAVPADKWTKVATNVTTGQIWIVSPVGITYLQTYRVTTGTAPTSISEGVPIDGAGMPISATSGIDVYIYPIGTAGTIRVDV